MEFDAERDEYTLSTGRRFYANCGILGINHELHVYDGYDGEFYAENNLPDNYTEGWTAAERKEIADEMVRRWQRWASLGVNRRTAAEREQENLCT